MRCLSGCETYAPGGRIPMINTTEPRDDGRCGPHFGYARCKHDYPWCNWHHSSGWCGNTAEHRDAQDDSQFDWRETDPWPATRVWDAEGSYGDALALQGPILAVGAPQGNSGAGYVDVRRALGPDDRGAQPPALAGNLRYTEWSLRRILSQPGSKGFGYRLAMKPGLLVVSAAGDADMGSGPAVYVYAVSTTTGSAVKLCEYSKPTGDFGVSLAIQQGRGNRYTVVVGSPSESHVYAILVTPSENTKCTMQTVIRQYFSFDSTGDGFGAAIAMTNQFLFIGAPSVLKNDPNGHQISGLLHILALCTEGNYLQPDYYMGCAPCAHGQWSTGAQIGACSRCIPEYASPLQACNFTCFAGYFGDNCLECAEAMSNANVTKPAHSHWIDGRDTCVFECDVSYERVGDECVKCGQAAADYNGQWIKETCSWTCTPTFFAEVEATDQPNCVLCSVVKETQGAWKPEHSEWLDGLVNCEFGPQIGYSCSGDVCEACPALAQHAHWTNVEPRLGARCDFACDEGYFGHPEFEGVCELCAVYLEDVLPRERRPSKPARSQWSNNVTCDASSWKCVPGTHLSSSADYCCPDVIANSVKDASEGPCQVRCLAGFWWDGDEASCRTCFPLPRHAQWSTGNCTFAPLPGYQCVDGVCSECPTASSLPVHASYIDSDVACTYACHEGFFGHPEYAGICERCSDFMQRVVSPGDRITLPNRAIWEDGVTCDDDSWTCEAGYTKSEHERYCCPNPPYANGAPFAQGSPCPVDCNPGFIWRNDDEQCANCPAHPDGAEWTHGCNFRCGSGLFGDELNVCVTCKEYRELKGTRLPPHASWPVDVMACGETAWVCEPQFYKSLEATPPGCCPTELPEGASWNGPEAHCGFTCIAGWTWDPESMMCVGCPASSVTTTPSTQADTYEWNGDSCSYRCKTAGQGAVGSRTYHPFPQDGGRLDECLVCADLADRMRWQKPEDAVWPDANSAECHANSWSCDPRYYIRPGSENLCCQRDAAPVEWRALSAAGKGSWVAGSCDWRCNEGYFPTVPLPADRSNTQKNCRLCKDYLRESNVPSCYSQDLLSHKQKDDLQCSSKEPATKPEKCVAQIFMTLILRGLPLDKFTRHVEDEIRNGFATTSQHVYASYVHVVSATERGIGRREASVEQEHVITLGVEIRNVPPHRANTASDEVARTAPEKVQQRLSWYGVPAQVDCAKQSAQPHLCDTEVSGGSSEWSCKSGKVFNEFTGKCCSKSIVSANEETRYLWAPDGCDFTCRKGYKQVHAGGRCLNCLEYNVEMKRYNPPNSRWKDDSEDCAEWECDAGHVRSASGFSCIPLPHLKQACAALTRCAQCVMDGDCVWCDGQCVGGQLRHGEPSCPYTSEGLVGPCTCEPDVCQSECTHTTCSSCVEDDYCGWCEGTKTCMLGSYFRPLISDCPAGTWITDSGVRCSSDENWWILGLVIASGSTLLVMFFGGYVITVLRRSARRRREQAAGRSPEQIQLRNETQRFMATFPTFQYNGTRLPKTQGADSSGQPDDDEDDEGPMCSICLVSQLQHCLLHTACLGICDSTHRGA